MPNRISQASQATHRRLPPPSVRLPPPPLARHHRRLSPLARRLRDPRLSPDHKNSQPRSERTTRSRTRILDRDTALPPVKQFGDVERFDRFAETVQAAADVHQAAGVGRNDAVGAGRQDALGFVLHHVA